MCQKRIFCRNHIRGLAALAAGLFLFTGSPQARAEESQPTPVPEYIRTADEIVIDDRYDELSAYSITFRNMQAYTPECFNYAKVTAAEELPAKELGEFLITVSDLEKRNLDRIQEDISWFIKKFDYRYEKEDWKNSRDAVERTANKMQGDCCHA